MTTGLGNRPFILKLCIGVFFVMIFILAISLAILISLFLPDKLTEVLAHTLNSFSKIKRTLPKQKGNLNAYRERDKSSSLSLTPHFAHFFSPVSFPPNVRVSENGSTAVTWPSGYSFLE
jgi:hypothetical protein